MLEAKLKSIFLLWHSSHFKDKFLSVYSFKSSSLVMTIFFPNTLTTFLQFPKNNFSRASIGTRASTGTFTLLSFFFLFILFFFLLPFNVNSLAIS